jgi:hypothetical protein
LVLGVVVAAPFGRCSKETAMPTLAVLAHRAAMAMVSSDIQRRKTYQTD